MLRFVLPNFQSGPINRQLHEYYFYNLLCPELVILRKEHGTSANTSFLTYVLEAHGQELTVLCCTEYTRDGAIDFEAGYPYLKLPDAAYTSWDYRMNDEIHVCCRSSFQAGSREIVLVERRMEYDDGDRQRCLYPVRDLCCRPGHHQNRMQTIKYNTCWSLNDLYTL